MNAGQQTLLDVIFRGGWAMLPLVACSVVALAVVLERSLWGTRKSRVIPGALLRQIKQLVDANRGDDVTNICAGGDSPLARIIFTASRNVRRSHEQAVEALEFAGRREYAALQRHVGILGTIAAVSPLLGLLGTVVGIIRTFGVIEEHGIGNPQLLAGGISEALVATASGICIAVPSLIFYRYFQHRARALTLELEEAAMDYVNRLQAKGSEEIHALR